MFYRLRAVKRAMASGALLAVYASAAIAAGNPDFDSETGYRIGHYRTPTPPDVPGGKRVDADDIDKLLPQGAKLIDVMPSEGPGLDAATGQWNLARTHDTIPNSVWLPDVGRGKLTPDLDCYLRRQLARLTGGDFSRPLVMFCQSDCWMSWNAVQRAAALGYKRLYWYPEGSDGWRDWDRKLAVAVPTPAERDQMDPATRTCRPYTPEPTSSGATTPGPASPASPPPR